MINRPAHSTWRRVGPAAVLSVAIALLGAAPAPAREPAIDEYSVDLPGGGSSGVSGDARGISEDSEVPPGQPGVVGESHAPGSALTSLGGAFASTPLPAAACLAALGILVFAARRRSHGR